MTTDQIVVTVGGLLAIGAIAAYFFLPKGGEERAIEGASGAQEVTIVVKGGYSPDRIVVEQGRPIRLHFRRDESGACSERVIFPDFRKSASLPEGQVVDLDLPAAKAGEYGFQCEMGMLRGTLVVR